MTAIPDRSPACQTGERIRRTVKHRNRNPLKDRLPVTPVMHTGKIIGPHQPYKPGRRGTDLQAFDGIGRCSVFQDPARFRSRRWLMTSQNAQLRPIRSLNGAMPATGLSGFCGATIHQTSSSPRCSSASWLMNRWPSWAGLNEPPNRPIRRPAAWFSNGRWAVRTWFVRCRARRISWS